MNARWKTMAIRTPGIVTEYRTGVHSSGCPLSSVLSSATVSRRLACRLQKSLTADQSREDGPNAGGTPWTERSRVQIPPARATALVEEQSIHSTVSPPLVGPSSRD